jgi:hypothetical protein
VQDAYYYDGQGWHTFTLAAAGSASTKGGIAAVSRSPNTMEVWWAGPNGSVQDAYYYDGQGWHTFTLAAAGSASAKGGIAAVSRSPNTMEVWWAGPGGSVQDAFFYDGGGWHRFTLAWDGSALTLGGVAAVPRSPLTIGTGAIDVNDIDREVDELTELAALGGNYGLSGMIHFTRYRPGGGVADKETATPSNLPLGSFNFDALYDGDAHHEGRTSSTTTRKRVSFGFDVGK